MVINLGLSMLDLKDVWCRSAELLTLRIRQSYLLPVPTIRVEWRPVILESGRNYGTNDLPGVNCVKCIIVELPIRLKFLLRMKLLLGSVMIPLS